ncbi:hypothetical protein PIB30_050182 [Stylosanthes scabra]|uniref:Uncharacterized protein n=1 Tax=Stylosanthes scabra TaxID=79078 RepID=A0ABU6SJ41_9FABA|nr:hypothetical protein [Stylosanthes scabra]
MFIGCWLTIRCALFGEYVDQLNNFLGSSYVEQPVVLVELAKVKFFRGQVGLQNVMHVTRLYFNLDIPKFVEFKKRKDPLWSLDMSGLSLMKVLGGTQLVFVEDLSGLRLVHITVIFASTM